MYCRNCANPVDDRAMFCPKCGVNPRTGTAFCQSCAKPTQPAEVVCTQCHSTLARPFPTSDPRASNKVLAGICGIVIGSIGIHKFVLGYTGAGLIMLLVTVLSCGLCAPIMHLIGLIEGIIYLTKSHEDFVNTYVVNQKTWFLLFGGHAGARAVPARSSNKVSAAGPCSTRLLVTLVPGRLDVWLMRCYDESFVETC